jgi:serine/threonine-protein kinase
MNIGDRIGDYEIVELLGAGGMGQVYKVRHVISERIEAMKIVLPNSGGDEEPAQRFLREIKVQARLDHPNIARLHTAQMVGNQLVLVMEYVEGSSLEKLLNQGTLRLQQSVNYIGQVLDGLAYAHSLGVIHRDIKPGNIMRTSAGMVKLTDFGIARVKGDQRLTQAGCGVGSLYYVSPEQMSGSDPDPRSDLYSLGITLYEMVTGRRPFTGTDQSVQAAHLHQTPYAPIDIVPGIPADLNDIILRAIEKNPAARFQNAEEFHTALQKTFYTPPYQPSSRRRLYMAAGSVATLVVLAAAMSEVPKRLTSRASGAATQIAAPTQSTPQVRPLPALATPRRWPALITQSPARQRALAGPKPPSPPAQSPGIETQVAAQAAVTVPKNLRDRLVRLQARAAAHEAALESISSQLKSQGMAVRPALSVARNTVQLKLAQAVAEMTDGKYTEAGESLDVAEASLQESERIYGR